MVRERERENGSRLVVSRASTLARGLGVVKCLTVLLLGLAACASEYQDVTIVIDDFRFSPARVDVQARQPLRLVVRNQGRETHRFQSGLFASPGVEVVWDSGKPAGSFEQGVSLAPGQRLELDLTLPPGVYHFRCPIKGHRGMQGMIVVQAPTRT
ncbi:MAG: cupredoxin domain-containing protein [Nitrospira sp.]|nr:cupredoxin domain-containing protein [Nitrospira sp.]